MPKTEMLAVIKETNCIEGVRISKVAIPEISEDEVLVKVISAGLCGTDMYIFKGRLDVTTPRIIGHEFSGEIVEIGSKVIGWQAGTRVVAELHTGVCGKCEFCVGGRRYLCSAKTPLGYGWDGAFAEYLKVPANLLHKLPDNISWDVGAMIEPLAICVESVANHGDFKEGYSVAISGSGVIGLLSLLLVKALGASTVIIGGTSRSADLKLSLAKQLGADFTVLTDKKDFAEAIFEKTNGRGVDIYIEASGVEPMIMAAPHAVVKGGNICAIGLTGKKNIGFDWDKAMYKACNVMFNVSSGTKAWQTGLDLLSSGRIDLEPLITHRFSLAEFNDAVKCIQKGQAIKIVLKP